MLNPAGLRRFPSPYSFFFLDFWWNFRAQMRREGEGWSFYRGDTPVARGGGRQAPPAARGLGPAAGRPWAGRQAPVARWGGDRAFFFPGTSLRIWRKKITLKACRPMGRRPGDIFEIFQNGHIFLKFLFFKNIKKKKRRQGVARPMGGDQGIFLKYFKMDIYFWNFYFLKI